MEKTEKPIVIWHGGCTDGFAALWAVYRALGEVEAVRGHYQSSDDEIARLTEMIAGRVVFIVDLSYPLDVLQRWRGHAKRIVLLDHHLTAFEKLASLWDVTPEDAESWAKGARRVTAKEDDLFICLDKSKSGAGLAWDHFFGLEPGPFAGNRSPWGIEGDKYMRPWLIDYVEDRDLWKFELPNSREINAFIKHQEQTFERWDCMADALSVDDAVLSGIAAKSVVDHFIDRAVSTARIVEIPGPDGLHVVPCFNGFYWNTSEAVERLAKTPMCLQAGITVREAMELHEKFSLDHRVVATEARRSNVLVSRNSMVDHPPFAFAWHVRSDGKMSYSLRSRAPEGGEAFDVSRLAKMYGGGGHRAAAGFSVVRPVHEPVPGGGLDLHEAGIAGVEAALKNVDVVKDAYERHFGGKAGA